MIKKWIAHLKADKDQLILWQTGNQDVRDTYYYARVELAIRWNELITAFLVCLIVDWEGGLMMSFKTADGFTMPDWKDIDDLKRKNAKLKAERDEWKKDAMGLAKELEFEQNPGATCAALTTHYELLIKLGSQDKEATDATSPEV